MISTHLPQSTRSREPSSSDARACAAGGGCICGTNKFMLDEYADRANQKTLHAEVVSVMITNAVLRSCHARPRRSAFVQNHDRKCRCGCSHATTNRIEPVQQVKLGQLQAPLPCNTLCRIAVCPASPEQQQNSKAYSARQLSALICESYAAMVQSPYR